MMLQMCNIFLWKDKTNTCSKLHSKAAYTYLVVDLLFLFNANEDVKRGHPHREVKHFTLLCNCIHAELQIQIAK